MRAADPVAEMRGPQQFQKKPIVIEAMQWDEFNLRELQAWGAPVTLLPASSGLIIGTLEDGPNCEAVHVADKGDWIIKGIKGEFYPCKPDIFAATYETPRRLGASVDVEGLAAKIYDAGVLTIGEYEEGYSDLPREVWVDKTAELTRKHIAQPAAPSSEPFKTSNPWHLFHHLWTKAVGTANYIKQEWRDMEAVLVRAKVVAPPEAEQEESNG